MANQHWDQVVSSVIVEPLWVWIFTSGSCILSLQQPPFVAINTSVPHWILGVTRVPHLAFCLSRRRFTVDGDGKKSDCGKRGLGWVGVGGFGETLSYNDIVWTTASSVCRASATALQYFLSNRALLLLVHLKCLDSGFPAPLVLLDWGQIFTLGGDKSLILLLEGLETGAELKWVSLRWECGHL